MATASPVNGDQPRRVRFAEFEFDLHTRELHKRGVRLRLHGMPLDVLAALIERGGDLVSRQELRDRLWPQDKFVDYENSLNSAVARLREAIGDLPGRPRFIETLPKRGYRFIARVEVVDRNELATVPAPTPPVSLAVRRDEEADNALSPATISDRRSGKRLVWWAAAVAALAALPGYWFGSSWLEGQRRLRESQAAFERGEMLLDDRNAAAAVTEFQNAIAIDPTHARAYGALAHALARTGTAEASSLYRPAGESPSVIAAERGVALDPSCGPCLGTLAMYLFYHDWQWSKSERHFTEAIRLAPDHESIRPAYAMLLVLLGRPAEALTQVDVALAKQPFHPTWLGIRASALYYGRRYEEAIVAADKVLLIDNKNVAAWDWRSKALFQVGRGEEAIHALAQALFAQHSAALDGAVRSGGAAGGLRKLLELTDDWRGRIEQSWRRAAWRALLGETEGSLDELTTAVKARRLNAPNFAVDPVYDGLRAHPRYQALLADVGLAPLHDAVGASSR
jgi:DNA-binding winged helix-turn-helix (wHTH) protein/Flp pilus assembly protein TadD